LQAARARHKACVSHLRTIAERVEDLEAENAELRASNEQLQRQVAELQVKHDAAQCHLDASITLAVTPRTRRGLEAQKRLLQPALGVRLASSFVEARHQKLQKEKANRHFQQGTPERMHATKSGADALSPRGPLPAGAAPAAVHGEAEETPPTPTG